MRGKKVPDFGGGNSDLPVVELVRDNLSVVRRVEKTSLRLIYGLFRKLEGLDSEQKE